MKKVVIWLLCICLLTGCGRGGFSYDENFDPNRGSQVLVGKYEDFYVVNMTDGIFICSNDFSNAEQLTYEYSFFPYVLEDEIYYVGEDEEYNPRIERVGLKTGNSEWMYSGKDISYFAPTENGWILIDGEKLVKLRNDGMKLFETDIPEIGYARFSNDKFLIYSKLWEPETVEMYNFETRKTIKLFSADGTVGENIICDGEYVYYTIYGGMHYNDFCRFNLNTEKNEVLIKNDFSGDFVVKDGMCYYYHYDEEKNMFLKSFNMNTAEVTVLKELENEISDINILDNKLFYRVTNFGKQIEMLNLENNETIYLYEKYSDIIKIHPN